MNSLIAEIFAVGKWNGMTFTVGDLEGIVKAFNQLKDFHKVPLKFGHNDEQPFTDGQPALGWVDSVWVENDILFAKLTDVPDAVFNAMSKKLYRHVSIELDMAVQHAGNDYELVLSGVALLGADIPAVNILKDLTAYMSQQKDRIAFSGKRRVFTVLEDNKMSDIDDLKAQLAAEKAKREQFERDNALLVEGQNKAKFAREKETLTAKLEDLVKSKTILPAKREEILKQWKDDDATVSSLSFTVGLLADMKASLPDTQSHGAQSGVESGKPDKIILSRINKMKTDHPSLSFAAAKEAVLKADVDLARSYITMTGEK